MLLLARSLLLKLGSQWVNNMEETITISKEEYEKHLKNEMWLECLNRAGLDNWEWIDVAQQMMEDMENTK